MRDVALITGASGGIGADLARVFARYGHALALVARNAAALDVLADEIAATGSPRPIVIAADLTTRDAVAAIASALTAAEARVAILVNNAGYGLTGPFATLEEGAQRGMVALNVDAVLALTHRFLPDIRAARGKILNVGSIVSVMPGPGMAVYYASKAFVSAFSRALGEELKADGIAVCVLHPGVTDTGFHARAGVTKQKGRSASSMAVAEAGFAGLMAGRRSIVPGVANRLAAWLLPLVPDAIILPLVHRFQRARR